MAVDLGHLEATLGLDNSGLNKALNQAQTRMKSAGKSMQAAGRSMTMFISAPLVAAGAGAVKFAADYQSAMVEVQKVTDRTTADKLSQSIMRMANTIPLAQTELAGLAADAARFGIRGVDNIESFTTSVAKMAEATDLTSDIAGEALAKISSQTNTSAQNVENLGSAINTMSNNFATSANEVVQSMLRSSAAASNFGLSASEIAGVAAQMNAMSESSERAGTRLRRLFQELLDPSKVGKYAEAIGMTVEEFQNLRDDSPRQAVMALVQAMSRGGEAADNLRRVTSTTSRQALTALSKNIGDTTRALDMSGKAFEENTSLQREFDAATKTFNARWTIMMNKLRQAGIQIGNQLMPIALDLVGVIQDAAGWFASLSSNGQRLTIALSGIAAAAGPALMVLGSIATVIGSISLPIVGVVAGIAALGAAIIFVADNWAAVKERISDWTWWRNMLVDMVQFFIENNPFGLVLKAQNALFDALGMQKIPNPFKAMADQLDVLKGETTDYEHKFGSFTDSVINMAGKAKDAILGMMPEGGASILPGKNEGTEAGKNAGRAYAKAFEKARKAPQGVSGEGAGGIGNIGLGDFEGRVKGGFEVPPPKWDKFGNSMRQLRDFTRGINQAVQQGFASMISSVAIGLGKLAAGVEDAGKNIGVNLLGAIASMTERLGKMAIGIGIGIKAIKEAFKSLNPAVAIAAGVALLALSGVVRGAIQNMGDTGGGGIESPEGGRLQGLRSGGFVTDGGAFQLHRDEVVSLPSGSAVTPANMGSGKSVNIQPELISIGEEMYISFKEQQRKHENT